MKQTHVTGNKLPNCFEIQNQPQGNNGPDNQPEKEDMGDQAITRADSWADEVEAVLKDTEDPNSHREDRGQWLQGKRNPSSWADNLCTDIRHSANQVGLRTRRNCDSEMAARHNDSERTAELHYVSEQKDLKHKCKKETPKVINHWFSDSTEEESDGNSQEDEEDWNTVSRE